MAIYKKLTKLGTSSGIVIDKSVLKLLNITNDTVLQVTPDNQGGLNIRPVRKNDKVFKQAVAEGHKLYGKVFKKSADA